MKVFALAENLCNGRPAADKGGISRRREQAAFMYLHRISLKVKIARVFFFHVFAVFHHPNARKSAYKQVFGSLPTPSFFWCNSYAKGFVCLRLNLCLSVWVSPRVVRRCSNSRRRLSCWLCTIKADCIFSSSLRCLDAVFEARSVTAGSSRLTLIAFHPDRENYIPQVGKRFVANFARRAPASNQRGEGILFLIVLQNQKKGPLILDIRRLEEICLLAIGQFCVFRRRKMF